MIDISWEIISFRIELTSCGDTVKIKSDSRQLINLFISSYSKTSHYIPYRFRKCLRNWINYVAKKTRVNLKWFLPWLIIWTDLTLHHIMRISTCTHRNPRELVSFATWPLRAILWGKLFWFLRTSLKCFFLKWQSLGRRWPIKGRAFGDPALLFPFLLLCTLGLVTNSHTLRPHLVQQAAPKSTLAC